MRVFVRGRVWHRTGIDRVAAAEAAAGKDKEEEEEEAEEEAEVEGCCLRAIHR